MSFGVYSRDCYKLSTDEKQKSLLAVFEDYGKALAYAKKAGSRTAIHWYD